MFLQKTHPCSLCEKKFTSTYSARRHELTIHGEGAPSTSSAEPAERCPVCNVPYVNMNRHIEAKHPDFHILTCPTCNKGGFSSLQSLKAHIRNFHEENSRLCPVCKDKFPVERLASHIAQKHPLWESPEQDFSPQVHRSLREIKRQEPIPAIPFLLECDECEMKFPRVSALKYHKKRMHTSEIPNEPANRDNDDDDDDDDDPDAYSYHDIEDPSKLYRLIREPEKGHNKKFNLSKTSYQYRLTRYALKFCRRGRALEVLRKIYQDVYDKSVPADKKGYVQLTLASEETLAFPINMPPYHIQDFSIEIFLNQVASVLTSRTSLLMDHPATLTVKFLADEHGGMTRCLQKHSSTLELWAHRKRGIWSPKALDPICFGLCIVVGLKIQALKKENVTMKSIYNRMFYRHGFFHQQTKDETIRLYEHLGIPTDREVATPDMQEFQRYLYNVYDTQIIVFDAVDTKVILFKGDLEKPEQERLYLALAENHFFLVTCPRYFLFPYYYICKTCGRIANRNGIHSCDWKCPMCFSKKCSRFYTQTEPPVFCSKCNTRFPRQFCFEQHLEEAACQTMITCRDCGQRIERQGAWGGPRTDHLCNEFVCRHCHKRVKIEPAHECTIQPVEKSKALGPEDYRVVCYDVETYTDQDGVLKPYLVVAIRLCPKCIVQIDVDFQPCAFCGERIFEWYGEELASKGFARWLVYEETHQKLPIFAFAHNAKAFDSCFLMSYALERGYTPETVIKGSKFFQIQWRNVTLRDFCCLLPAKLAALPKALGFEHLLTEGIGKSWFPWKFASEDTLDYIGEVPEKQYFAPELMGEEERRDKFEDFYAKLLEKGEYDFRLEAVKYCFIDTQILTLALQKVKAVSLEISDGTCDQITGKDFTLPGFTMTMFRNRFMEPGSIGIMSLNNYGIAKRKHSSLANGYFDYVNFHRKKDRQIRHAGNSSCEKRIILHDSTAIFVDGYCEREKMIYEVEGCFYHGHTECSPNPFMQRKKQHPLFKITWGEVEEKSRQRREKIRKSKYALTTIRECEIEKMKQDPTFAAFWKNWGCFKNYALPLDPREALYGGRTEVFKFCHILSDQDLNKGVRIKMLDAVSLYPTVQKKDDFPRIPHPVEILYGPNRVPKGGKEWGLDELQEHFGIVKCLIEAPGDLWIPVLPQRCRGKTVFSLCRTCAQNASLEACQHDTPDRQLLGVWTTPELEKAVQFGYRIDWVFEVWSWGPRKDPYVRQDLFKDFINRMLELKVSNGGWPTDDHEGYLKLWQEKEGIILREEQIRKDACMYKMAKSYLVSLWGKMCQSSDRVKTSWANTYEQLRSFLTNPNITISSLEEVPPRNNTLCITYRENENVQEECGFYNVFLASLVTSHGRCRLFDSIEPLGARLLYVDTDSAAFVSIPGLDEPKTGICLGDMSNDFDHSDEYAVKFFALAPKTYRIETKRETDPAYHSVKIRTKGFALNCPQTSALDERVFFSVMKRQYEKAAQRFFDRCSDTDPQGVESAGRRLAVMRAKGELLGMPISCPTLTRHKATAKVLEWRNRTKILCPHADKRLFEPDEPFLISLPFGYKEPLTAEELMGENRTFTPSPIPTPCLSNAKQEPPSPPVGEFSSAEDED